MSQSRSGLLLMLPATSFQFSAASIDTLFLVFKLDRVYFAYALPVGVVPAMASLFFSYSRNMMMAFPLFIALALFLKTGARRISYWALAAIMAAIQVWFLLRHINFVWAA